MGQRETRHICVRQDIVEGQGGGAHSRPPPGGNGLAANDPGDGAAGPNSLQNKPSISSAKKDVAGATTTLGKLSGTPRSALRLQFFSNPRAPTRSSSLADDAFSRSLLGRIFAHFLLLPRAACCFGKLPLAAVGRNKLHFFLTFSGI